jgi:hypothetical protein
VPKEPLDRILLRPNLVRETVKADEGDMRGLAFPLPITAARNGSKKGHSLPVNGKLSRISLTIAF